MLGTLVGTIIGPFASVYSENVTTPGPRSTLVMYVNTICSYVQLSKTAHFHVVWIIGPKKGEPRILVSYLIPHSPDDALISATLTPIQI